MANEYDDETTVAEPETDPADYANAAAFLAEQMRWEEEELERQRVAAALPAQEREAAIARERWRIAGQPAVPRATELDFGTVMPTSKGFMYVGKGVTPPEAGYPLGITRAYESAMQRGNLPEANVAYQQLAAAGLKPPGRYIGGPAQVPVPTPTPAAEREEVFDRFQRARAAGVPVTEATAMSGAALLPSGVMRPMTEYQRMSTALRGRQIALQEEMGRRRLELSEKRLSAMKPTWERQDQKRWDDAQKRMDEIEAGLREFPDDPNADRLSDEWISLRDQQGLIENKYFRGTPTVSPPAVGTSTAKPGGYKVRRVK